MLPWRFPPPRPSCPTTAFPISDLFEQAVGQKISASAGVEPRINMHKLTLRHRYLCKKPLNLNVLTRRTDVLKGGQMASANMFEHGNAARSDRNFISRLGGRIYCVCSSLSVRCAGPDSGIWGAVYALGCPTPLFMRQGAHFPGRNVTQIPLTAPTGSKI